MPTKKPQRARANALTDAAESGKKKKKAAKKKITIKKVGVPKKPSAPVAARPPPVVETTADEPPPKRKRATVTLETYMEKIRAAVEKCESEISRLSSNPTGERKGIKTLKSVRRTLLELEHKAPKLTKLRRRYHMSGSVRKNSGLTTPQQISDELRSFLRINEDRQLSRIEVTRAINSYIHLKEDEKRPNILVWGYLNLNQRNLQNGEDKRIIFPDKPLAHLLRYPQYKQDVAERKITEARKNKATGIKETVLVTSDALHYRTVQKLIQIHYK